MPTIQLPWGKGSVTFAVDPRRLGEVVRPNAPTAAGDPAHEVRQALQHPVGSDPLEKIVSAGQRVALIVDDVTRPTPADRMLPPVLETLARAGVSPSDVIIAVALGSHRPMTEGEIDAKLGAAVRRAYPVFNVDCTDMEQMVYKGTSSQGIAAWVLRPVAEADVRIGIGAIAPHMDAGFSGGAKIVLPGVCGAPTVAAFHARQAGGFGNQLGCREAPMRLDLEAFVGERVGLDFIVNAVLAGDGRLAGCVAGHFVAAHRAGVQGALEVYGVPVAARYPVVVANAFPNDIDFWQSSKGIAGGERMTADGGTLILTTPCPEGHRATHPLFAQYLAGDMEDLVRQLADNTAQDAIACAIAVPVLQIKERIRIAVVSPGMDPGVVRLMGFSFFDSIAEALASLSPAGPVGVLTHGGVTLPLPPAEAVGGRLPEWICKRRSFPIDSKEPGAAPEGAPSAGDPPEPQCCGGEIK